MYFEYVLLYQHHTRIDYHTLLQQLRAADYYDTTLFRFVWKSRYLQGLPPYFEYMNILYYI